eukprot:CAMPEP_0177786174 /NCGR_PEP_ID=MMETSP0491_2-20121128/20775_1 /TAXON_ID=63592 /ORGANISM="Tetraselmis chuii, Strain PLY429" /LENGTH=114 /DNA_ID=CAMNT_0019307353 /DNA_START=81 /DNA_END=426 /DNA_ORIENTATION=-
MAARALLQTSSQDSVEAFWSNFMPAEPVELQADAVAGFIIVFVSAPPLSRPPPRVPDTDLTSSTPYFICMNVSLHFIEAMIALWCAWLGVSCAVCTSETIGSLFEQRDEENGVI